MKKRISRFFKHFAAVILITAMFMPLTAVNTHAQIFFLQTGRRFDSDFYAAYYPDLRAKYGYNAHKLLDHYLNYGMFERRIPAAMYIYNMDALQLGDITPKELLYQRKSLRKNCTKAEFYNAYDEAYPIVIAAREMYPNNMLGQMSYVAKTLYERINFNPGVPYKTKGAHYNDPCGVFGNVDKDENGVRIPYGCDCAGATRAMGLCLNMLQIPYNHINENQWKQQWCQVTINGRRYAIDPYLTPNVMDEWSYVRMYPPF
ncbi:MAG: hypothetical protein K6E49_06125 [Lachnospiraceae bacterium]|nr:hypothetical protein [Lachnospiraceae bacterium]